MLTTLDLTEEQTAMLDAIREAYAPINARTPKGILPAGDDYEAARALLQKAKAAGVPAFLLAGAAMGDSKTKQTRLVNKLNRTEADLRAALGR